MTKQEMIDEIRRLDPAYEDVDLVSKPLWELEYLLSYIEDDPDNADSHD